MSDIQLITFYDVNGQILSIRITITKNNNGYDAKSSLIQINGNLTDIVGCTSINKPTAIDAVAEVLLLLQNQNNISIPQCVAFLRVDDMVTPASLMAALRRLHLNFVTPFVFL
ncbi:hypothetical protein [Yersinia proxima]|uniref:hypothetical protein n=1 Tax=Yersinia proxima TaxID=2890316 RepID=UPI003D692298